MENHRELFKEGNTSLGTFYPTHYITAGYHNLADAKAAAAAFVQAGFTDDDVQVFDGSFVTAQLETHKASNWVERMEQHLSEFAGTEASYLVEDANHARAGGAFLFVYAPDDERVQQARSVFARHAPAYARRYLKVAIEIIVENPRSP